jgi:DNA-binding transcriptional MerR regulator
MTDNKAALIREMLEDGMSPKEIKEELQKDDIKVTSQYIYNVRLRMKEAEKEEAPEKRKAEDYDDPKDDDAKEDYFTRFPKEERKELQEFEDYECGNCGAAWKAPRNKYQALCPECGVEFN